MLNPKCPWCETKVSTYQLGNREPKVKPKWYAFTRYVSVCPYCNNPIRVNPKSLRWLGLFFPLLLISIARMLIGKEAIPVSPYNEIGFFLAVLGLLISIFTIEYEKSENL